ncbi:hypothetical protein [Enterobacter pseudoroggenkampii]|uniref:hypothetical protein n=1 Tax=Enterobacter pseudoroggenkampii TaxID=2996112 RepID=UPI002264A928|nr:hypothetical protein [Enterobacter pseudoroggenkampii]MCX8289086.1 hypothetical protein [Enterobacter pseudoroggenkampii]
MTNTKELYLPAFKAPENFFDIYEATPTTFMKRFNLDEATAKDIYYQILCSMQKQSIEIDRESILKENLAPEEWDNYCNEGYFYYDGDKYDSECNLIEE